MEKVSYTAKDGQYLRWDYRNKKMLKSVQYRKQKGKAPLIIRLDKREIPSLKETLLDELRSVTGNIIFIQRDKNRPTDSTLKFVEGSALFELPKLESNILDGVITNIASLL
ncbi:hypothetical protein AGMMS49573_00260 [Endomicrobiia bacterium]|uniref:hypothetical protein n=1 Tax=Endomicrobium trichonymphae TaxID=1408204 RepID=UPI00221BA040|nr:hypothetical protein AGMMS49532_01400 [Endomicrobiia bacterium]GHT15010.1 hypothetical protein AGMMS49573_00260 [Endomicrobiia bacterium]GHT25096.1 hypothetical protein AGMMS49953_09180 [Endomicrobiia bacterium]